VADKQVADRGADKQVAVDRAAVADQETMAPAEAAKGVASPGVGPAAMACSPQKPDLGRLRASRPWGSMRLNLGNSKSTEYWNSSTRASLPTSRGAKSASPPH
jgi:hypothetical protein